uniref:Ovule protein n=1 Tax=Rodentolepis nana TaxID=102285 RepID=A0A0R3TGX7_RODNA
LRSVSKHPPSSNKGETVDSGTLPIRREFKISRCNELKQQKRNSGQWHSPT